MEIFSILWPGTLEAGSLYSHGHGNVSLTLMYKRGKNESSTIELEKQWDTLCPYSYTQESPHKGKQEQPMFPLMGPSPFEGCSLFMLSNSTPFFPQCVALNSGFHCVSNKPPRLGRNVHRPFFIFLMIFLLLDHCYHSRPTDLPCSDSPFTGRWFLEWVLALPAIGAHVSTSLQGWHDSIRAQSQAPLSAACLNWIVIIWWSLVIFPI